MNFLEWKKYFLANQGHFDHMQWSSDTPLSNRERELITSSIRQFQRGEHSEGKHFLQFARSQQDESYVDTVKLFIREEQDHAMVLGRYMDLQGIARIGEAWLDNVFRWLRKLAGLEGTVTVLLTAEIISMVYYKALKAATPSRLLAQVCKQILIDEEMHLRFQCYTLRIFLARKGRVHNTLSSLIHHVLMTGTIMMVWLFHAKVLRAGGVGLGSFIGAVWKEFKHCRRMISGNATSVPVFHHINTAA